jgi:hypothetical protein
MPHLTRIVSPGPLPRSVRTPEGQVLHPPADWVLVPPGDPALTRRIKAAGPTWTVQEKVGRKLFSRGVWTPDTTVQTMREELASERATPQYARKRQADAQRRNEQQEQYVQDFHQAVLTFLAFAAPYAAMADELARRVTTHATPVGSGTVARTERIPVEERAQAALIAWMRHQTTAYDHMAIPRIKGQRRQVRRKLAAECQDLLETYRCGREVDPNTCPLQRALRASPTP